MSQKTVMRTRSHSPPIHVHVPESTALHVHLKRGQSCTSTQQLNQNERPTGALRATSRVRAKVPWVPPGKNTAPRDNYKWEGSSHCLEITPVPQSDAGSSPLRLADLSKDEQGDEGGRESRSKYGRRADSLMSEVDPLMRKVRLQEKTHLLERRSEHLDACQRLIGVREEQLAEASKELEESRRANTDLRRSLEKMQGDAEHDRPQGGAQGGPSDIDILLRKLVEAEIDGEAAAKQVAALRDVVGRLKQEKKLSRPDAAVLGRQHEALVKKLEAFENTNCALRQLLRDQHGRETDAMRLMDEREGLLKRLAESEAEKMRLESKLNVKMREASQITENLEGEKDLAVSSRYLSKALETTHGHLQKQLRKKEVENDHLGAQIEVMEDTLQQQRAEMQSLQEQMRELQRHQEVDQEALRQASQSQRQRAEQSEGHTSQLATHLKEKEAQLADALSSAEELRLRHTKELRERKQQDLELIGLKNRVTELTEELQSTGDKFRAEKEGLLDRLHRLTAEASSTRLENQRLKTTLSGTEDRLSVSQSELQQLKSTVMDFENLVDGYKTQVQKTRQESEEYQSRLEASERESRGLRADCEREVEQARRRVRELEPLREVLRRAEEQLKEARDQEEKLRRRSAEQSDALGDMRLKLKEQNSHIETLQEKNHLLLEENKHLRHSIETMERRLEEANSQSRELLDTLAKRDERMRSSQLRLDDKSRENEILSRQLEEARGEAHRQVEQSLERALTKERTVQAKALDLETQLNVAKSEMNQLRRCKDEMERRMQGRLEELKKKLEQSDSTNRSLQNYVHYLKASYTNVFGDSFLTSTAHAHM